MVQKSAIVAFLPLLVHGAVVALQPRQTMGDVERLGTAALTQLASLAGPLSSLFMSKKKAYKIENIAAVTGVPQAKRIWITYGPYKVKAANSTVRVGNGMSMDKGGTSWMHLVDDDFPKDVMVLEAHSEIVTPDFKRATTEEGLYNHHNVFMHLASPGIAFGCTTGKPQGQLPMSVLAAGATEDGILRYYATEGDVKSGYYLEKDRKILNMIDVINYRDEEREIYTSTELEFLEGKPEGYLHATEQRVDPGICGGPNGANIHPPVGQNKFSVASRDIVAQRDGYILNARGHMHDGGVNIVLKINDQEVCNSKAVYGGEGHTSKTADGKIWETIRESSYCNTPVKVKKGDKLFMQANYDIGLHPSREQGHGGMGGMKVILDEGKGAEQMALVVTNFAFIP